MPRYSEKFEIPGQEPDTSINVFGREIYAHSTVLKLHSEFFEKFMDAPNPPPESPNSCRYKYVTAVDEDGHWGLEKARPLEPSQIGAVDRYPGDASRETEAFFRLLSAMYSLPYTFEKEEDLVAMCLVADFYLAVPIMSSTLTAALLGSPPMIEEGPELFLLIAEFLRHPLLFQDSSLHLAKELYVEAENYQQPFEPHDHSPAINFVRRAYEEMCTQVMMTERRVMKLALETTAAGITTVCPHWTNLQSSDITRRENLFEYYRGIQKECLEFVASHPDSNTSSAATWHSRLATTISPLMEDKLCFPVSSDCDKSRWFRCFALVDESFPWVSGETTPLEFFRAAFVCFVSLED